MHEGEGSQCHKEGGDVAMLHQRNPGRRGVSGTFRGRGAAHKSQGRNW